MTRVNIKTGKIIEKEELADKILKNNYNNMLKNM